MQKFISSCLVAIAAQAEWSNFKVIEDGSIVNKSIKRANPGDPLETSYEDWQVAVPANTSILIHDNPYAGSEYAYMPAIRGGSINYWVYMGQMESGCVAGVYLATLNEACDADAAMMNEPNCPSIDVMQANPWGFEMAAHPCEYGECDPQSQCTYNMRKQGVELYGADAFGAGGTLIDTD